MEQITVTSRRRHEWIDVTPAIAAAVARLGLRDGAVLVFSPHTTAGVTVNEAWDPAVADDAARFSEALVPADWPGFRHAEGNSDAHVNTSLVGPSVVVPVADGRLGLGRWQGIFLCEFDGPRTRTLTVTGIAAAPGPAGAS
jgi:secondary thiamine-phosphate synthase enzyme